MDVDYFDPNIVPEVGHRVASCDNHENRRLFSDICSKVSEHLVGWDLVEWHGKKEGDKGFTTVIWAFNQLSTLSRGAVCM